MNLSDSKIGNSVYYEHERDMRLEEEEDCRDIREFMAEEEDDA